MAPESPASFHLVPALSGWPTGLPQGLLGAGAPATALSSILSNSDDRCGPASLESEWLVTPRNPLVRAERVKFFQVGARGLDTLALTFPASLPGLYK